MSQYLTTPLGWDIPLLPRIQSLMTNTGSLLCPAESNVFRALSFFRPEDTRVIILGQDPYPTEDRSGQKKASGLAFGYHKSYRGPVSSSLLNIFTELANSGCGTTDTSLESWAKQGVLLLNTQLTCELGKPLSHKGVWDVVVSDILYQALLAAGKVVGLSWGAPARKILSRLLPETSLVSTSHPCRYSASATDSPFLGSNCFNRVNEILENLNHSPIVWGERRRDNNGPEGEELAVPTFRTETGIITGRLTV